MIEVIPNWHPLIVHFTIALLLTAAALFVLGALLAKRPLGAAVTLVARWNLALGVLATIVTLATGWQAYNTVAHDEPSHANMTVHMQWAFGTAAVFLLAAGAAWLDRRRSAGAGGLLLALILAGSGALAVTGWYGGENVYRYGLGVKSLPKTDSHVHPGGEAAGHSHPEDGHDHGGSPSAASSDMSNMPGMEGQTSKAQPGAAPPPVPNTGAPAAQSPEPGAAHKH
jgi:uncharacterized membrane protein